MKKWIIFLGLASLISLASCKNNSSEATTVNITTTKVETTTVEVTTTVDITTTKEDIYYTVTFINYDDTLLLEVKVKEGEDAVYTLDSPVKPSDDEFNYEFSGWDHSLEDIESNITLKAKYTAKAKVGWNEIEWF